MVYFVLSPLVLLECSFYNKLEVSIKITIISW